MLDYARLRASRIEVFPFAIDVARWSRLVETVVRALVRSNLREHLGPRLDQEFDRYKGALDLWMRLTSRNMVAFVDSYADPYRAQLNRVRGLFGGKRTSPELAQDLARLLRWNSEAHSEPKRA